MAGSKFLADFQRILSILHRLVFCPADLVDSGGFGVSISKKQLFSHFFLHFGGFSFYQFIKSRLLQKHNCRISGGLPADLTNSFKRTVT
jgi:hypothetical protein